ncbi:hypothetical protein BaRGS_00015594 [Batillaria attramentaria]|uniref:Uncharacterized protein n=1 Tax=Batillaria attramentaria TaxID=370345 RepID=A0ABD0L0M8_9CAEN
MGAYVSADEDSGQVSAHSQAAGHSLNSQTAGQNSPFFNASRTTSFSSVSGQTSPGYAQNQSSFTQFSDAHSQGWDSRFQTHGVQLHHSQSSSQLISHNSVHGGGIPHSHSFGQFSHTTVSNGQEEYPPDSGHNTGHASSSHGAEQTHYSYDPNYEDDEPIYDFISYDHESISGDTREASDPYYIYTRSDSGVCSDRPASETSGQTVLPCDEDSNEVLYDPVYVSHSDYVDCMSSPRTFTGLKDVTQPQSKGHSGRQDGLGCSGEDGRAAVALGRGAPRDHAPHSTLKRARLDASHLGPLDVPDESIRDALSVAPGASLGDSSGSSTPLASPADFTGDSLKLEFVFPSVPEEAAVSLADTCTSDDVFLPETPSAAVKSNDHPKSAVRPSRADHLSAISKKPCGGTDLGVTSRETAPSGFKHAAPDSTHKEHTQQNVTASKGSFHTELEQTLARRLSATSAIAREEVDDSASNKGRQKPVMQRTKSCKALKPPVPPKPLLRRNTSWFQGR